MTHPASGHLFSGLGWVTGDCLGGPAHGPLGLPPEAPSLTWGLLLPSPRPARRPPLSPSASLPVSPAPLSGDVYPRAPVSLRLLGLPGSWMSLCVWPPGPPPSLLSPLSPASHLRIPIFLLLGVPEFHLRVGPAPLVWAPRKTTHPPSPAAALRGAQARGLVCGAHFRVSPRLGWETALSGRPVSPHLPGLVQPESELPRSRGLPARLLVPGPPLLSPLQLPVRLSREALSVPCSARPPVRLPAVFVSAFVPPFLRPGQLRDIPSPHTSPPRGPPLLRPNLDQPGLWALLPGQRGQNIA